MCRGGHDDKEEEEKRIGREGRKKENGDSLERAQTREDQEVSNKRWNWWRVRQRRKRKGLDKEEEQNIRKRSKT